MTKTALYECRSLWNVNKIEINCSHNTKKKSVGTSIWYPFYTAAHTPKSLVDRPIHTSTNHRHSNEYSIHRVSAESERCNRRVDPNLKSLHQKLFRDSDTATLLIFQLRCRASIDDWMLIFVAVVWHIDVFHPIAGMIVVYGILADDNLPIPVVVLCSEIRFCFFLVKRFGKIFRFFLLSQHLVEEMDQNKCVHRASVYAPQHVKFDGDLNQMPDQYVG